MNLHRNDAKAAERFLAEHKALNAAHWQNVVDVKYSQMGPYAEAIGRTGDPLASPRTGPLPLFQPSKSWEVKLVPGARWARADDFGKDAVGEVRRWCVRSFGAAMVVFDYNRDGRPDLFLAAQWSRVVRYAISCCATTGMGLCRCHGGSGSGGAAADARLLRGRLRQR